MKQVCNLMELLADGSALAGTITLEDGVLSAEFAPGNENLVNEVMATVNVTRDVDYNPREDPEGWFNALPTMYHGSYFWAEMQPAQKADVSSILKKK